MSLVEGQLLSDVNANYPGSIVPHEGGYQLGKKQGGLSPVDKHYNLADIPVVKACSHYAGGALFLTYNAEGKTESSLKFYASPTLEGLEDKGGNCPHAATTPTPVNVRPMLLPCFLCMYVCMHVCVMCIYVCVCMYVCICICIYVYYIHDHLH
jgi:hypothetical protein